MLKQATGHFRLPFTKRLKLFKERRGTPGENETNFRHTERVSLHVASNIAVISIRRPGKLNAIDEKMWVELIETIRRVSRDERVRAMVLRGAGDNFSVGADLKEMGESGIARAEDIFHLMEECAATLEESPVPSIACIRGHVLGSGLLLALACDLRVVASSATLGMPIARLGITLTEPFAYRLASLIGPSRMKDLVCTGRLIDASEALEWGLANRKVDTERTALRETLHLASVIAAQSRASILAAKRWGGSGSGRVPAAYSYVDAADFPEGVQAFLERRLPRFNRPGAD